MKIEQFFRKHPVFTWQTFLRELDPSTTKNRNTLKNTLAYHLKVGHVVRIKRGLFASIPYGADPRNYIVDPFLVAGFMAEDALIGYHSALQFYGAAYSVSYRYLYLTKTKAREVDFQGITFRASPFPKPLITKKQTHCYTVKKDIQGLSVLITSKERTLVDALDRPLLARGWEEIWRSLNMIERFNIKDIIDYALLLGTATTIAKVGFYLERRQQELNVSESELRTLEKHCPVSAHYIENYFKEKCKYIKRWNIIVPESIVNQNWDEDEFSHGDMI